MKGLDQLRQELRLAVRALAQRPLFTTVVLLTLALGIGANSAIFSVVYGVLLRPLPYEAPDRLVLVWQQSVRAGIDLAPTSGPNFLDWQRQNEVFTDLVPYALVDLNLTGGEIPERVQAARVGASLFSVLGVEPALGRGFLPGEDTYEAAPVVVLHHRLWQRRFGGDPGVLGRSVTLDGGVYQVVGVMPRGFDFADSDLWIPLVMTPAESSLRGRFFLRTLGRLAPGVSLEQARANMETIAQAIARENGPYAEGWEVRLVPLLEQLVGDVRPALLVLSGAVVFLLLLACVNVAHLFLVRARQRRRETAIRTALGIGARRLVFSTLVESVLLALLGGGLGLLLAAAGTGWLLRLEPAELPRTGEIGIHPPVVAFTVVVALVTGVLFGLVPALEAARTDPNAALRQEGGAGGEGGRAQARRKLLVVLQVVLALLLLVGAGLAVRSFRLLSEVDPGFDPRNTLVTRLSLPPHKVQGPSELTLFYQQLLEAVEALPGVSQAGLVGALPLGQRSLIQNVVIEGRELPGGKLPTAQVDPVSPDYFRAMGIALRRGRLFTPQDREDGVPLAIVDEATARLWWPGEDAVGKRVEVRGVTHEFRQVVGVVAEVKRLGLDTQAGPQVYVPLRQYPLPSLSLVVRTQGEPLALAEALRQRIWGLDRDLPIEDLSTMERRLERSLAQRRFNMRVMGIFAGVALVLALVGIYGVVSFLVTQRTREIGVRMALGAQRQQVLAMVLREGITMALAGLAIGLVVSLIFGRLMESLLYGVRPGDPQTLATSAGLLTLTAVAAVMLPARRAMKVNPMEALRHD